MQVRSRFSLKCSIIEMTNLEQCAALAGVHYVLSVIFLVLFFNAPLPPDFLLLSSWHMPHIWLSVSLPLSSLPKNHSANMIIQHLSDGQIELRLSDIKEIYICCFSFLLLFFFFLLPFFFSLNLLFCPLLHCQNLDDL